MPNPTDKRNIIFKLRLVLGIFIFALVLSGVTAFPLQREMESLASARGLNQVPANAASGFDHWILIVRDGLQESYSKYPWLAYGTDWLAFAHIVLAVFFIGPLLNPIRNVWVLQAGIMACALVIPLAIICGNIRHIPFGWRLIDCSFGVFGIVPLFYCLQLTRKLEKNFP